MESTNLAVTYFLDYWEDLWSGVSSKRDLLTIFNPRVVIRELLDEITLNKISNKANEEFFRRTLNNYLKNDPGSKKRLKLYLQMMVKEFDLTKHRPRYLPLLCQSALKLFDDFKYFEDCIESLLEIIASNQFTSNDKNEIKRIINHLIVEFREVGYTDEEIRKFPNKVFSTIHYTSKQYPIWDFPHQYLCSDWENEIELEKYKQKLETYQSTLTVEDRIQAFLTIARKNKELIRYIFQVNGMTGLGELQVSDVLFYSPLKKRLMNPNNPFDPENNEELFKYKTNSQPVNASVLVEALSEQSGEILARSKVEKAFALCRRIMRGENRLLLSRSHLTLDTNGNATGGSYHMFEKNDDDFTKLFSLDTEKQTDLQDNLIRIEKTKKIANENGWSRRFNEACYWLKRADESDSYVDKLLSYWICIETLCSKSEQEKANWFVTNDSQKETDIFLIREIVGKMRAVSKCYEHGWMLHQRLSPRPFIFKNLGIPEELLSRAQLNVTSGRIYLKNFIDCSDELKNHLPEGLLKEQLEELHLFYTNKQHASEILRMHLQSTQDELAFVYRMRNKIAHDGHSDHPLLPSVCKIAEDYAVSLFFQISRQVVEDREYELDKILIMAVHKYDLKELQLQTEEPVNVFLNQNE